MRRNGVTSSDGTREGEGNASARGKIASSFYAFQGPCRGASLRARNSTREKEIDSWRRTYRSSGTGAQRVRRAKEPRSSVTSLPNFERLSTPAFQTSAGLVRQAANIAA